ncbi:MAG: sulfatase-like hydrolase/transferase [Verrucomicrobiota bacterium]
MNCTSKPTLALSSYFLFASLLLIVNGVSGETRPNVIIILSDDSGYSDLGSYGGEIETPNLDRLAENGMRLTNFYTNGRCSPTRASLMTGLESAKVGFGGGVVGDWSREMPFPARRGRLSYDFPTLAELLRDEGYQTSMVGKWHLGGSLMKFSEGLQKAWKQSHEGWELTDEEIEADFLALPKQRGFDEYFGIFKAQDNLFFKPGQPHPYVDGNEKAEIEYDRDYTIHTYPSEPGTPYSQNHGKSGPVFHATDGITDRAIEMIEDASKEDAPFFLYVAYRAPHRPWQAPESLVQKYLPKYEDLRAAQRERVERLKSEGLFPDDGAYKPSWLPPDQDTFRRQLALHAAMMEGIDQNVARLMQALVDTGELDNTLILYFSDNGSVSKLHEFMNAPYRGSKALVWEGGLKSHCIAYWRGRIAPGTISNEQVWVGDWMPTILDIIDADYPTEFRGNELAPMDGRSVVSVLKGESIAPHEVLYFNDKGQQSVIYKGRWKLLIEPGWYLQTIAKPGIVHELYDLENDPSESKNLARQNPELVEQLAKIARQRESDQEIVDYAEVVKVRPRDPY